MSTGHSGGLLVDSAARETRPWRMSLVLADAAKTPRYFLLMSLGLIHGDRVVNVYSVRSKPGTWSQKRCALSGTRVQSEYGRDE
jgi:hypothetical protein